MITDLLNADGTFDSPTHALQAMAAIARRALKSDRRHATLSTDDLVQTAVAALEGDPARRVALARALEGEETISPEDAREMLRVFWDKAKKKIVDHARKRGAAKRGGGATKVPLEWLDDVAVALDGDRALDLSDALEKLDRVDARAHDAFIYRRVYGFTEEETGELLAPHNDGQPLSVAQVRRDDKTARAFLKRELEG